MGKEEIRHYNCVFQEQVQDCPVRATFKLMPENLVKFCKTCPLIGIKADNAKKNGMTMEMIFQVANIAAEKLGTMFQTQNEERKRLLELVEKLALAKA